MNIGGLATTRIMRIGQRYLLRDEFLFAKAAGSVSGTSAEPGPGVRTVTDTENKLSIAGGQLVFAGGKASPAAGDPGLWYPAQARVAGKIEFAAFTIAATTTICYPVVFGTVVGNASANALRFMTGAAVNTIDNGVSSPSLATYAANTSYAVAIILRASGAYYFIKGGAFTNWMILWSTAINNTATLYPAISNYSAAFTADNIRIPDRLYIPTPLAYDDFTRADGALGSSEAVGPDGQQTPQLAWTGATWAIVSGKAVNTPTGPNDYYATQNHTTANVMTDIALAAYAAGTAGSCFRVDSAASPANFVRAYQDAGNVKIDEVVAGSVTNLGTYASAYAAGNVLRVSLDGAAWRLYKITSAGAATLLGAGSTAVTTGTRHGLFSTDAGNALDGWQCWARGNEGQYAALEAM